MNKLLNKKLKISINKQNLIWFLLLLPLLKTNGFIGNVPLLSKINNGLALISVIIIIYIYLNRKKYYDAKSFLYLILFYFYILFRSYLNHDNISLSGSIVTSFYSIGLCLYVLTLIDRPVVLIKSLFYNFEIYIYLNLLTLFIFPNGLYFVSTSTSSRWFLGIDNWWYIFFYVAFFIAILYGKITKSWFRPLLLITIIHISSILRMSGVLMFGIIFWDVLIFSGFYKSKLVSYRNVFLVTVIANILLMTFSSSELVEYVVNLTGRPIDTLLVRNRLWDITMAEVTKNPWFGNGRKSAIYRSQIMYNMRAGVNAHSMWLEILYEGGIVAAFLFVFIVINAWNKKFDNIQNEIKPFLLVCIMTCTIGLSVDSVLFENRGNLFFILFIIAPNIDVFLSNIIFENQYPKKRRKMIIKF